MISDIWSLGKEYTKIYGEPDFIQEPGADYAILIKLKKEENKLKFEGIEIEEIKEDWKKYMYKQGSPNWRDFTASSMISISSKKNIEKNIKKELEKKLKKRVIKWIEDNKNIIPGLLEVFNEEFEKIEKEIIAKIKDEVKKRFLITLLIDGKYLNELLSPDYIKKEVIKRFKEYKSYASIGTGKCIFCGKEGIVYGLTLPVIGFQFYTVDKPGFAPHFKGELSWKQVPICQSCSLYLTAGKEFLDKYLKFKGGSIGLSFYIIPSFIFNKEEAIKKFIKKTEKIERFHKNIEIELDKTKKWENIKIIKEEDRIYNIVEDSSDSLRLNFLFFHLKNSRFLILNYVSDVKPSWLRRIYETQRDISDEKIFSEEITQKLIGKNKAGNFFARILNANEKNILWWAIFLKNLFVNNKSKKKTKNEIIPKGYIRILSSILKGRKISYSYLLHKFNLFLQDSFKNKKNLNIDTLKTLAIYLFLDKLNLLEADKMNEKEMDNMDKFFNLKIFSNNERKHAFLVGALANYVLFIQRLERGCNYGEEPFRSKFNNLIIDQKRLQKIYVMCVEKLNQYGKPIPAWFFRYFNVNILNIPEKWRSSTDEISYFFTLGLTLGKILNKKQDNKEGD